MAVKVSEGSDGSYLAAGSTDFLRRGRAAGLLCLGYHYLHPGNEDIQAKVFAESLRSTAVPGMLDAEALAADGRTPTLTVTGIRGFLDACQALGANVPLLYLPAWYWDRLGHPSLCRAAPVMGGEVCRYQRRISTSIGDVPVARSGRLNSYGSLAVEVLQCTDRAQVAGQLVDANHYRRTREQFAALIGRPHRGKDRHDMDQLPATAMPADSDSDPRGWPQRNYDVGFGPAGGWEDGFAFALGVQDWPVARWTPPGVPAAGVVDHGRSQPGSGGSGLRP